MAIRSGRLRPSSPQLKVASWNVEGLTDSKLMQLEMIMEERGISLLCIQETKRSMSDVWATAGGYFVILSGSNGSGKERAGVGFIIAPSLRTAIVSFRQENDRMAALKLRVRGGKAVFVSAYAPHSGYVYSVWQKFFHNLDSFVGDYPAMNQKLFAEISMPSLRLSPPCWK